MCRIDQHLGLFGQHAVREGNRQGGMTGSSAVEGLRHQQAALAAFGSFALREDDLQKILEEAARVCAVSLNVPYAKICRYRADQNDLFVVAGHGWHANVVGFVVSRADETSTQGRTFVTGEPVIVDDTSSSNGFSLPPSYAEHGILSTADVLIKGEAGAWDILEVHSPIKRRFDQHDIVY